MWWKFDLLVVLGKNKIPILYYPSLIFSILVKMFDSSQLTDWIESVNAMLLPWLKRLIYHLLVTKTKTSKRWSWDTIKDASEITSYLLLQLLSAEFRNFSTTFLTYSALKCNKMFYTTFNQKQPWLDVLHLSVSLNVLLTITVECLLCKKHEWSRECFQTKHKTSTLYSTNRPLYLITWVWQTAVPPQFSICYGTTCCL